MSEQRPSNPLLAALEKWMQEQWMRVPAVPHSQPGSYDRGYNNGMADILRGMREVITRAADDETSAVKKPCEPDDHLYAARAGSPIGDGVCIKCGAQEPPENGEPANG